MKKSISIILVIATMISFIFPIISAYSEETRYVGDTTEDGILIGDVNGDGVICITEAYIILHFLDGTPSVFDNDERAQEAAITNNGLEEPRKPSMDDVISILLYINEINYPDCDCCDYCSGCQKIYLKYPDICGCQKCMIYIEQTSNIEWCGCPYDAGHVRGEDEIEIGDALEVLMYLANIEKSIIFTSEKAYKAACIIGGDKPTINDALEILMYLAGMRNVIG